MFQNSARNSGFEQTNGSKFVVEHRFECPICLTCLKDPLLTSCGHRFCQECIHEWLKEKDGLCPIDSQALSITKDLFPDNFTRREIAQQTRNCPVEGCSQLFPLLEMEKHISTVHQECNQQEETILCTFHNVGCNVQLQSVQQLNSHLDSQLHQHLALLASSVSSAQRRQSDFKGQESQLWEAPSKNGEEDQEDSWKNLLKSLYERIVLLEQSNREQEIQITSLRAQVNRLVEENENFKYNVPMQFCNGVCIWTIDKFQEKYFSMTEDNNRCFYSPAFTTSYVGYKFCARLKLSIEDPNYLSLLIHLKQGEYDRALDWPFSGRISFTLVHPTIPDLTIKETMMSRPELEAFKRPSRDISPRGFGYSQFVLVSDVLTKGFLDKDSLIIKVQIQTV